MKRLKKHETVTSETCNETSKKPNNLKHPFGNFGR